MQQETARASSRVLIRLVVVIITAWSIAAGLSLALFSGTGGGFLGEGVSDETGKRLAGVHMLVLAPLYLLIAWKPRQYGSLLWIPFLAQALTSVAVAYSIATGDTDVIDGLPLAAISGLLAVFLAFVWTTEQRAQAAAEFEAKQEAERSRELSADELTEP